MSAESGPLTTDIVYTDDLVATGHHGKHCPEGDVKTYPARGPVFKFTIQVTNNYKEVNLICPGTDDIIL